MDISTAILFSAIAFHGADWAQTLNIAHHQSMHETNRVLGREPRNSDINRYFATTAIAGVGMYALSDPRKKPAIAMLWLGVGAGSVINNYRAGIKINF